MIGSTGRRQSCETFRINLIAGGQLQRRSKQKQLVSRRLKQVILCVTGIYGWIPLKQRL